MVNIVELVDSHVHLHEYGDSWAKYCDGNYLMVAVSDDLDSSLKTLDISKRCSFVLPAVGVHPWNADKVLPEEVLARTERLVIEGRVKVLGEVGLDRSFRAETYDAQMKLFLGFLKIATEYELGVSIHAAGAWKDVFSLVKSYKVPTAVFHWYTGPHDLLNEIVAEGYFIGINPAIIVQKKHEDVLRRAPLEAILTESDGPYRYRGMTLGPEMLKDLVRKVAEIKSVDPEVVIEQVKRNFITFLSNIRA